VRAFGPRLVVDRAAGPLVTFASGLSSFSSIRMM
jgi:hypothetical protein